MFTATVTCRLIVALAFLWLSGAASASSWSVGVLPRPANSAPGGIAADAELIGVSCPSPSACVAVGSFVDRAGAKRPLIERWNGSRWEQEPGGRLSWLPDDRHHGAWLNAVDCVSPSVCVAVGGLTSLTRTRTPLAERLSGPRWIAHPIAAAGTAEATLRGVSCRSASRCTAVGVSGGRPLVLRLVTTRWRRDRTPVLPPSALGDSGFNAVACPSSHACFAVGHTGCESLVERWNGSRWFLQRTPDQGECTDRDTDAPAFFGVSCPSTVACVMVGWRQALHEGEIDRPLAERWDGRTWSMRGLDRIVTSVSCPRSTSCTAVGVQLPLVSAEHWNGRHWAPQPVPAPRSRALGWTLNAVSCSRSRKCVAVGGFTDLSGGTRPLVARYR